MTGKRKSAAAHSRYFKGVQHPLYRILNYYHLSSPHLVRDGEEPGAKVKLFLLGIGAFETSSGRAADAAIGWLA